MWGTRHCSWEDTALFTPIQWDCREKNRTLTDLVNVMLETAGLSKEWWGEVILTTCHVLNYVPMKNKEVTPFDEWEKKRLTLSYLRLGVAWPKLVCQSPRNVNLDLRRWTVFFWAMLFTASDTDHSNQVNNGSRTCSIRYFHCRGPVASWTPNGLADSWKNDTDNSSELW
jgi:hypothetical protein